MSLNSLFLMSNLTECGEVSNNLFESRLCMENSN